MAAGERWDVGSTVIPDDALEGEHGGGYFSKQP